MFRKMLATVTMAASTLGVAHADWYQADTEHFTIIAYEKPDQISARAVALERYDRALRLFHHIPTPAVAPVNRVTVFVVHSVDDIAALGAQGAVGFYIPRASDSVAFTPERGEEDPRGSVNSTPREYMLDPQTVLRHEYAHHFMFNNFESAALPLWFTEGFAEFHATAMTGADGSITFGQMPVYRGGNFAYSHGCSAARVVSTGDLRKLDNCVYSDLYAYGWLITDYLTFSEGGPAKLATYVRAINAGKPLDKAAAEAFGDLRQFERDLDTRLDQKKLPAFTVPATALQIAAPSVRKLTPGEAASIRVRIRSKAGVTDKAAPGVFAQAQRAAAPFPNDPAAQLALAEAAFDAQQYDAADAAAQRAAAADPKSEGAQLYLGLIGIERARAAKTTDPTIWRTIRHRLLAANHLDPYDARPMAAYYTTFVLAAEAPTANAMAGLLQAEALAPQAQDLRWLVAYADLRDGKLPDARQQLTTIAYAPHGGGAARAATALLDMIDRGDRQGALGKIEARIRDPKAAEKGDNKS